MNTGVEGTDATIAYSRRAEELGADALMIRPTSYIPTVASEHIEFFCTRRRGGWDPHFFARPKYGAGSAGNGGSLCKATRKPLLHQGRNPSDHSQNVRGSKPDR